MNVPSLQIFAIFQHLATWRRRARFRAQLRMDIEGAADFLCDIGINVPDAQIEAARFFWEPIALTRPHVASADAVLEGKMEVGWRSDKLWDAERLTSREVIAKASDAVRTGGNSVGALETPTIVSAPRLTPINQ